MVALIESYAPNAKDPNGLNRVGRFFVERGTFAEQSRLQVLDASGEKMALTTNERQAPPLAQSGEAGWLQRKLQHALVITGGVDSELAHNLLDHYMSGTGDSYVLSASEMADVQAFLNGSNGPFDAITLESVQVLSENGVLSVDLLASAGAQTGGTLGQFLIHYKGNITVDNGSYRFQGTMKYIDNYDFTNANNSGRSDTGKFRTWYGRNFISGKEFPVSSVAVPVDMTY